MSEIHVDYIAPPSTIDEAVQTADVVVLGFVRGVRSYQPPLNTTVRMIYSVEVTAILRNHAAVTTPTLDVYRLGGQVDRGDYVENVVEAGFPNFVPGHQYVLFLTWNSALTAFEVFRGPDGAFELLPDGTVDSASRSRFGQAQTAKLAGSLISDVKRAAAAVR